VVALEVVKVLQQVLAVEVVQEAYFKPLVFLLPQELL
jgi:hypothetical protein